MKWDRTTIAVAVPTAIVAVVAGIVSYGHIEALALSVHQTIAQARLLPFAVDGLIAAGSAVLLAGSRLGWLGVVTGVAGTLYANIMSGVPYGPLSASVAAWPAIAFTVASFILERWIKRQVNRGGQGGTGVAAEVATSGHFPAADVDESSTIPATPDQCGHVLTGDPDVVVVNAYLHGRDCLGETPSQRSLAATYKVHRTKVAALVGPLNGHGQPDMAGRHERA